MLSEGLDRHLAALDVVVHPFVLCEVDSAHRLKLPPMDLPLAHYVLTGSGLLCTGRDDCVPVSPHSLIFLPPGTAHFLAMTLDAGAEVGAADSCSPLADGLLKFSAAPDPASERLVTACGTLTANLATGLGLFERLREPLVEDCHGNPAVRQAFEQMLEELSRPRFGTRALTEALVKQCLVLVLRAQLGRGEMGLLPLLTYQDQRLAPAVTAMLDDPASDHSLESLAELARMGRSLFAERFSEVFGQPPIEFLKQLRLHHGARLLRTTDMPVALIASAVGYASRSYFSRAFRETYGSDPRRYRDEMRAREKGARASSSLGSFGEKLMRKLTGQKSNRTEPASE